MSACVKGCQKGRREGLRSLKNFILSVLIIKETLASAYWMICKVKTYLERSTRFSMILCLKRDLEKSTRHINDMKIKKHLEKSTRLLKDLIIEEHLERSTRPLIIW